MIKEKKRWENQVKNISKLLILIIIIFSVIFVAVRCSDGEQKPKTPAAESTVNVTVQTTTEAKATKLPTTTAIIKTSSKAVTTIKDSAAYAVSDDVARGCLVLVNSHHYYSFPSGVERVDMNDYAKDIFTCSKSGLPLNKECISNMQSMLSGFKALYTDPLTVISGYRSYKLQKTNFDNSVKRQGYEETLKWYALPGASEHHTGYAFDFNTSYTGSGNYKWINENCYKYGFVVRYDSSKSSITGISHEPWHFRYVSVPHAYYMTKNNLCLEEYIKLLYNYPENGNHLEFTADNGKLYEVYYVKGSSLDKVTKPAGVYSISGNNIDGFIVTITH